MLHQTGVHIAEFLPRSRAHELSRRRSTWVVNASNTQGGGKFSCVCNIRCTRVMHTIDAIQLETWHVPRACATTCACRAVYNAPNPILRPRRWRQVLCHSACVEPQCTGAAERDQLVKGVALGRSVSDWANARLGSASKPRSLHRKECALLWSALPHNCPSHKSTRVHVQTVSLRLTLRELCALSG